MKDEKDYVVAKCVICGHKQKIHAGEVKSDEVPVCEKCFGPMCAEKAVKS